MSALAVRWWWWWTTRVVGTKLHLPRLLRRVPLPAARSPSLPLPAAARLGAGPQRAATCPPPPLAPQTSGRRIAVGAGQRLGEVYLRALGEAGGTISVGTCAGNGASGFVLGGGVGPFTRRLGWVTDSVVAVKAVTADGRKVEASARQNAALFWAVRGGGGGHAIVYEASCRRAVVGGACVCVWERFGGGAEGG